MSTEKERLARKQLQIVKLSAQSETLAKELYHRLEMSANTDEQKALVKRIKSLDKKIDKFDDRYWTRSEELREERDKAFQDFYASLES